MEGFVQKYKNNFVAQRKYKKDLQSFDQLQQVVIDIGTVLKVYQRVLITSPSWLYKLETEVILAFCESFRGDIERVNSCLTTSAGHPSIGIA